MTPIISPFPARAAGALVASALLGACAAPSGTSSPAQEPRPERPAALAPASAVPVTTREAMLEALEGRPLHLVHPDIEAELTFLDGTAEGTLTRPDEAPIPMLLEWEWVDGAYCRTGTVDAAPLERQCETVTLYPGVGVELDYITSDDPTELWVFDRAAVPDLRGSN